MGHVPKGIGRKIKIIYMTSWSCLFPSLPSNIVEGVAAWGKFFTFPHPGHYGVPCIKDGVVAHIFNKPLGFCNIPGKIPDLGRVMVVRVDSCSWTSFLHYITMGIKSSAIKLYPRLQFNLYIEYEGPSKSVGKQRKDLSRDQLTACKQKHKGSRSLYIEDGRIDSVPQGKCRSLIVIDGMKKKPSQPEVRVHEG
eukprot:921871-Pelagomonas_calceolata.AAC.2